MHLVIYPINFKSEFNLVIITRRSLSDENFFKNEANIRQFIKDSIIQKNSKFKIFFENVEDIKCFPTFISD